MTIHLRNREPERLDENGYPGDFNDSHFKFSSMKIAAILDCCSCLLHAKFIEVTVIQLHP